MIGKSALALLAACCVASPAAAVAMPEADCAAQWKSADGNGDGVLVGPEADRYLAYYRVRAKVMPVDGRISRAEFVDGPTTAFDLADRNHDGQLSKEEIDAAASAMKSPRQAR